MQEKNDCRSNKYREANILITAKVENQIPQKLQTKSLKNRKWRPCYPYRMSLAVMTSLVWQSIFNGICEHRHWLIRNDGVNNQFCGVAQFDTTL